ncbi:hypothetical protein ACTFIT_011171 [Dictyostelium discoideum]
MTSTEIKFNRIFYFSQLTKFEQFIISVVGLDNNSNEINCIVTKAIFNQITCSVLEGFNSSTYIVDANTTISSTSTSIKCNSFCDCNSGSCICDCKSNQEFETQDENSLSAINYIEIKKNGKTLFGRLINQAVVDYRSTLISSSIISKDETSVIISLFYYQLILKLHVIVQIVIPLAVALPIGGAFAIAATTFFIVKKRK